MKNKPVTKNGKTYNCFSGTPCYHFETMSEAGWVQITSIGSENLYFTFKDDAGISHDGYCKCL